MLFEVKFCDEWWDWGDLRLFVELNLGFCVVSLSFFVLIMVELDVVMDGGVVIVVVVVFGVFVVVCVILVGVKVLVVVIL